MNTGFNRVVLFGNLGASPELRKLQNGQNLLRMRLATNHSFLNREGEREDRVEWHTVIMWGPRAEGLSRILHKGSFLLVEGHIRTHSYERDGVKKWTTEVLAQNVVLGGRCGPSGHEDMDGADDAERAGDGETMRDEGFDAPEMEARRDAGSGPAHEPREPNDPREPEMFQPGDGGRPPRGGNGSSGAAAPPPPAPRKKARSSGGAPAMAAA